MTHKWSSAKSTSNNSCRGTITNNYTSEARSCSILTCESRSFTGNFVPKKTESLTNNACTPGNSITSGNSKTSESVVFYLIIGARHAIEVLGKTTYNILNKRSANNPRTLKTIHLNAFNDYYTNFEDFLVDLVDLINERLMQVYDGSLLKLRNPRSNFDKENAHQNLWEWYSYEMTRFWTTLSGYLKTERIH